MKSRKKKETGILMTGRRREGWQSFPTPEEARARFAELVDAWRNLSDEYETVARLVVDGEVVEEIELRGGKARER